MQFLEEITHHLQISYPIAGELPQQETNYKENEFDNIK